MAMAFEKDTLGSTILFEGVIDLCCPHANIKQEQQINAITCFNHQVCGVQ
jgi:hypothetical protein